MGKEPTGMAPFPSASLTQVRGMDEWKLTFNEKGLIPAVVQEATTKDVLMMAWMSRESLEKTLETGTTWFYSRSREELWNKGATSGHFQQVRHITADCDGDSLLISVDQTGPACHTGKPSCFFTPLAESTEATQKTAAQPILDQLVHVLQKRRRDPQKGSYTNYLFDSGLDKMLKKVGEESAEVIIAAKNPDKKELIHEISDLVYHVMVMMNERDVSLKELEAELLRRHGARREPGSE